jgi:hypothetical protein
MAFAHFSVVITRAGGVSSIPRRRILSAALAITGQSAFTDDDNKEQMNPWTL